MQWMAMQNISVISAMMQKSFTNTVPNYCLNGMLLKFAKLVIPKMIQGDILEKIHVQSGHQGINKCRAKASEAV